MTTSELRVAQRTVAEAVELLESGYVPDPPPPVGGPDGAHRRTLTGYDRRVYDALTAAQRVLGPDREYQLNWPRVAKVPAGALTREELATWFTRTVNSERSSDGLIASTIRDGSLLAAFRQIMALED